MAVGAGVRAPREHFRLGRRRKPLFRRYCRLHAQRPHGLVPPLHAADPAYVQRHARPLDPVVGAGGSRPSDQPGLGSASWPIATWGASTPKPPRIALTTPTVPPTPARPQP